MVDFQFYKETHLGKLSELAFNRQLPFAMKIFNNATFNRVEVWNDDFRHCVCGLIDVNHDAQEQGDITGTSDGVTSVSYNTNITAEQKQQEVINIWLSGYYDLTYGGFRR